jgi:aminoglycoside phosphotransferase (APT) family kinase protein
MAVMSPPRMHHDPIDTDVDLVRRLLAAQQPQFAALPIEAYVSTGTDNALYRLGDDMVVRLPLRPSAVPSLAKEQRWLPVLAPTLPLRVPVPVAAGRPTAEHPWPWAVYPWLAGTDAATAPLDREGAVDDLARFIAALHALDPAGGPRSSAAARDRGGPLAARDEHTRRAIDASARLVDARAVTAAWVDALQAPPWPGPPVWVHGDIASGNLLVRDRRPCAVIDWGALAVGDPACDLFVAWELFDAGQRDRFRTALAVDDATWRRARGWALSTAILALPYYEATNAFMAAQARHKLASVLADF